MGNKARLGVFCLMGLAIGLARLIEVEYQPERLGIAEAGVSAPTAKSPAVQATRGPLTVTPKPAAATPKVKPTPRGRTYKVKPGDTLDRISARVYGTRRHWRLIRDANKDRFPDPRRMRPGVELRIPPVPPSGR